MTYISFCVTTSSDNYSIQVFQIDASSPGENGRSLEVHDSASRVGGFFATTPDDLVVRSLACTWVPGPVIVVPTPTFEKLPIVESGRRLQSRHNAGASSHNLVATAVVSYNTDISNSPLKHIPS